jgi:foldase protein PrsA
MRNVKLLWGIVCVLTVCAAGLIMGLVWAIGQLKSNEAKLNPTPVPSQVIANVGQRQFTIDDLQKSLLEHQGTEHLKQLLDQEVVRMEAKELGLQVLDEDIDKELKWMQQGYDNEGQFYQAMKEQLGFTKAELRDDVLNKLLLEKVATHNIVITDANIDVYIKQHPEEFQSKFEYHLAQIIVESKDQSDKLLSLLARGSHFDELAREQSLDDVTANNGGDLGWVEEDDPFIRSDIMKAAKALKPGSISSPIPLEKGFAVIQLIDKRTKKDSSTAFSRENIRKQLALQQAPPLKDLVKELWVKKNVKITNPNFLQ